MFAAVLSPACRETIEILVHRTILYGSNFCHLPAFSRIVSHALRILETYSYLALVPTHSHYNVSCVIYKRCVWHGPSWLLVLFKSVVANIYSLYFYRLASHLHCIVRFWNTIYYLMIARVECGTRNSVYSYAY